MTLYDISRPLSCTLPVFPGDPEVQLAPITEAAPFHLTRLSLGSHSGTHIDAPAHLLENGPGVDHIPLDTLIGPCRVVDLSKDRGPISAAELEACELAGVSRLLLRTRNSQLWKNRAFCENYIGLTADAAALLVALNIKLVGIDYLSIEPFKGDGTVHRTLLEAGTVILEGLDLGSILPGDYELICLPLKIEGGDGAPCRTVLRKDVK